MKYKDELGNWQEIYTQPSGDTLPIGAIMAYSSNVVPTNWLLCDGQEVSRTEYQELFNRIGTTYGTGDGSTTFNLPDLKGKVIAGLNPEDTDFNTLNKVGGEKTHTLTIGEMPSHRHKQDFWNNIGGYGGSNIPLSGGNLVQQDSETVKASGGDEPHNNLQPYIVENYIIKAKNSVGLVGNITDVYSISDQDSYSCDYINNKLLNIDKGEVNVSTTNNEWIEINVTFNKVFNNIPTVLITPQSAGVAFGTPDAAIKKGSITKSGFTIVYRSNYNAEYGNKISYLAIE